MLSFSSLGKRTGVEVQKYDFSDPQAGKDACDRSIAAMKTHICRFINKDHDVQTAHDMKAALDLYSGVKGCYVAVYVVKNSYQNMVKHFFPSIQAFNNFKFDSNGLRVSKAYEVGQGKYFTNAQLMKIAPPQEATSMTIIEEFGMPDKEVGAIASTSLLIAESSGKDTQSNQDSALSDAGQITDQDEELCFF